VGTARYVILSRRSTWLIPVQHVVAYLVATGKFINFVSYVSHPERAGTAFDDPLSSVSLLRSCIDSTKGGSQKFFPSSR
jgi:hypothetical protein